MTFTEFAKGIAWLTTAIRRPIADGAGQDGEQAREMAMRIYFDCLGDLGYEVFQIACKRVALAHPWPTFPSVAELRKAATDTMSGEAKSLTAGEAWEMAYRVAQSIDPGITGPYWRNGELFPSQLASLTKGMPPIVADCIRNFGGPAVLCEADPNFARREFTAMFEKLQAARREERLLPATMREAIARIGRDSKAAAAITDRGQTPTRVAIAMEKVGRKCD